MISISFQMFYALILKIKEEKMKNMICDSRIQLYVGVGGKRGGDDNYPPGGHFTPPAMCENRSTHLQCETVQNSRSRFQCFSQMWLIGHISDSFNLKILISRCGKWTSTTEDPFATYSSHQPRPDRIQTASRPHPDRIQTASRLHLDHI